MTEIPIGVTCDNGSGTPFLARRDAMKQNIDRLIAQKGEGAVYLR